MLEKTDQILKQKKYHANFGSIMEASYICWVADQVGKKYNFKAKQIKNNTLEIMVTSNILATEIKMKSMSIIDEINQKLKKDKIKKLKFNIGSNYELKNPCTNEVTRLTH